MEKNSWMAQTTSDKGELAKRAFKYEEGDIQTAWTNMEDVEVVISQFWMESVLKIQNIDKEELSIQCLPIINRLIKNTNNINTNITVTIDKEGEVSCQKRKM